MRYREITEAGGDDPEALRHWFAGSVIADDDGNPLLVHHFTYYEFTEFDRLYMVKTRGRNPEGFDTIGIWFTDNSQAKYAGADLGGRRMDCYLRIARPFYMDDIEDAEGNVNTAKNHDAAGQLLRMVKDEGGSTAVRNRLKSEGYDGIIMLGTKLDRWKQTVFIAFEPDQVWIVNNRPMKDLGY